MSATYRLQLSSAFTFADAAAQIPYLADLGITTLYLSPILQASAGSTHGYDVVDHDRVSDDLGGEIGLRSLASAAHARGLSTLVDVVPNHVGLDYATAAVRTLLEGGREAATAHWFDVDWEAGGDKVVLPVLGADLKHEIADGALRRATRDGAEVIEYHEQAFPIAPDSGDGDLVDVLERQHYVLVPWDETNLNFRRFFAVTSLIAVRVELPDVFEATHRLLLELHHDGVIDGFRIDHPDGLAEPEGYLRQLRSQLKPGTPVYVEKILQGDETLPPWPVEGTTGYEAIRAISLALADPAALPSLDATWQATDGEPRLDEVVDEAKRYIVHDVLHPELSRLTRRAAEALGAAEEAVEPAVVELLVAARVYRAYADRAPARVSTYRRTVLEAVARAEHSRPDLGGTLRQLAAMILDPQGDAAADFSVRIHQVWSAVLAKAVEDTAFYRWHRLIALNEVGGEPDALAEENDFHTWAAHRATHWPQALTPLSTHDTKRSEDVRARILAVAADTAAWKQCTEVFSEAADQLDVDRPTAHFVWQTMLGVGDIEPDRLDAALVKSVREAAVHTSWTGADEKYEQRVLDLAHAAQGPGRLRDALTSALTRNEQRIRAVVLGQKAVQLLAPGIPDIYQGTELVELSLVDPDNRRPVDYDVRRAALGRLWEQEPETLDEEKLFVTSRLLHLRQELPDAFGSRGRYAPLTADSSIDGAPAPVLGFLRGDRVACLVSTAAHEGEWLIERVPLPTGIWRDRLSGHTCSSLPTVATCSELFARFPVAVLVRDP